MEKRKIIFLDFDGPIATRHTHAAAKADTEGLDRVESAKYLDPVLVGHVEAICAATGAEVVLSTSWVTIHGVNTCIKYLTEKGLSPGRVTGATPRRMSNYFRGNEISWWLDNNPDVEYVILDDDRDFHEDQLKRHVETPFNTGLTAKQADQIIALFTTGTPLPVREEKE